ncbi:TetR/AcrR family transcriptional regulator [Alphaproteobacteria bacterium LSUCC0719]
MSKDSVLQERAIRTREALREAFIYSLERNGYLDTSISKVAEAANSSVGAFQNHFGTKKAALMLFWEDYCTEANEEIDAIRGQFIRASSFETEEFLFCLSQKTAKLQEANTGLNQAMNVHFVKDRNLHQKTIEVMENMVDTIFEVLSTKADVKVSPGAARFAAQIIITLNLNYTLGGARLLPTNAEARHRGLARSAAAHIV